MASFLSNILSLFSGAPKSGAAKSGSAAKLAAEPQVHGDCTIFAEPMREGNQFRLAGRIEKVVDGETLERVFIRADVFSSADDALDGTFRKARQIIDQNGASLFSDGAKSRSA
ncbi:transcriptional activator HlyU [Agrobacterium sp. a22-2]|uniref:HlyU family transcriptional regulator n=1 Tax=Agrobacterium sp. a22-2 TaxID=2283840 RepID=UPI001445D604|nr:HlyU family transcriptional regulator [Agrobacterium sp. a22-2]NKN36650.1 transcriptional activator HlyU [Agrobacterium sp. a22-2]